MKMKQLPVLGQLGYILQAGKADQAEIATHAFRGQLYKDHCQVGKMPMKTLVLQITEIPKTMDYMKTAFWPYKSDVAEVRVVFELNLGE